MWFLSWANRFLFEQSKKHVELHFTPWARSFFLFGQVHKQSRVWFIWQRVCTIHFFHYRLNNASQFYLYFEICNGFMFVSESCLHSHSSFWQVFCIQFSSIPKLDDDDDDDRNLIKVKESNWENVSAWKTYTENKMREEEKTRVHMMNAGYLQFQAIWKVLCSILKGISNYFWL